MKKIGISVNIPESWEQLSDSQLHYVYALLGDNLSAAQIKVYCFFRWSGIKILYPYGDGWYVKQGTRKGVMLSGVIAAAIHVLDYLDKPSPNPVRLSSIRGRSACDASLIDFPFGKFLYCDNLYQQYLADQEYDSLQEMARLLYDDETLTLNNAEKLSVFYWWASVKTLFSKMFPNFLEPVGPDELLVGGAQLASRIRSAMNTQIRALTGGDVTKEKEVLDIDVWRAMTELDAKAKDYKEMEAKYGKK